MSKFNADRLGEIEHLLEDINFSLGKNIDTLRREDDDRWIAYADLADELDQIVETLENATNKFIEETK